MDNRMDVGRKRPLDSFSSSEDSDSSQEDHNSFCGTVKVSCYINEQPKNTLKCKTHYKERKERKLREFRNFLMPKNAIAALHELQGPGITEYIVTKHGKQTKAKIVINNVKYEAIASNKYQAKTKVSEKALCDIIFGQMAQLKQQQNAYQKQQQQLAAGHTVVRTDKLNNLPVDVKTEAMQCVEKEDIPIELLASFALHKLFAEWEAEGYKMPIIKMSREKTTTQAQKPAPVEIETETENGLRTSLMPKLIKTVGDLPPNANRYHPTALFTYMRPKVLYDDLDSNNDRLNPEFTVRLQSDGHDFIGKGRSKKLARKAAAIDACKQLFGVVFDESLDVDACCIVSVQIPVRTTSSSQEWSLYQGWF